jgi:ATP-dependent DNA ligase
MAFNKDKIKELYPEAMMYEAQLINKGTDTLLKTACESGEYFGQLKKDGFWYQCEIHSNNKYLFSRTASRTTGLQSEKGANVPHIMQALSILPPSTILIGEIYYPGGSSKDTTTIMGCLPAKAIERQNGSYGKIHYYVHDILMYNGINFVSAETGAWDRYCILKKIWDKYNLNQYDFLELAEAWTDNLYSRVGDSLAAGEEGMVIKKKDAKYEPGKRPTTNLKAKKVDFIDAIVIGFEKPTKEYYGKELDTWGYNVLLPEEKRLQGNYKDLCETYGKENILPVTKPYYYNWNNSRIIIGAYDDEGHKQKIGVIHSGISDEMKQAMSENPMTYLNNVCMIQCMELDKTAHTIRHGFFKGIREDKDELDCTFKDIFN